MRQTRLLKIFDEQADAENIRAAAATLVSGGLVVIPPETVYGLAANALEASAVAKIFVAKGRPQDNPLIVHISDRSMLEMVAQDVPQAAYRLVDRFWPGPLTIIMPKNPAVPSIVSAGLDTVAVRFPSHPIAQAIIGAAGVPLAAPSANLSGRPSTTTAQHCVHDLTGKVDIIVDSGPCSVGIESTVISLLGGMPSCCARARLPTSSLRRCSVRWRSTKRCSTRSTRMLWFPRPA
jgi:L-threonylcarbamoyladenylate synthase